MWKTLWLFCELAVDFRRTACGSSVDFLLMRCSRVALKLWGTRESAVEKSPGTVEKRRSTVEKWHAAVENSVGIPWESDASCG
jgi:hypothetical protein